MGGSGLSAVSGFIISIPAIEGGEPLWMRVVDGQMVQHGAGTGWLHATGLSELPKGDRIMLVAPVGLTNLHWTDFPELSPRQGRAAARLMALDNSIGPAETLHVATNETAASEDSHNVAVVARSQMADWLLWAQHQGLDPDIILPAALLLPHPEEDFVRGVIGGETVLRGPDSALAADDPIAPAILGDAPVTDIPFEEINCTAIAALAQPPLNLRQGDFAKKGRRLLDWAGIRRIAILAGVAALGSLIIALILMAKYSLAAGAVDAESVALARTVLPRVDSAAEARAQLDAKIIERGGGGLGFSGAASGLFMAMREAPNVSIANMTHSADGTLRVTLSAPRVEDINMVLIALQEAGFTITAAPQQGQGGQALADLTVRVS
jgi:general secretion pathway protein L